MGGKKEQSIWVKSTKSRIKINLLRQKKNGENRLGFFFFSGTPKRKFRNK